MRFYSGKIDDNLIVFPERMLVRKYFHADRNVSSFSTVSQFFSAENHYSQNCTIL